jgi:dTDP-4-dehydrorhamnose 3,5-epimerase
MEIRPLAVLDSYLLVPEPLRDSRGCFYESVRRDELAAATGHVFDLAQANYSVSRRGVLRGLHGVLMPPGQAKIVTCHRGALLDVVVDIRIGSPTFGRHDSSLLSADNGRSVHIAEGLAHGFVALADDTCIGYLCSTSFVPGTQLDLNPFDPDLDLPWGSADQFLVSDKDATAPTLKAAADLGLLPHYEDCLKLYESRR